MICVVNCYGQRAHTQPLARVGQTAGVGMAGMTLGGATFDVPMGRRSGAAGTSCGAAAGARGHLV